MRPIANRGRVALLAIGLATCLSLLGGTAAQAAAFPCKSYLHQLRTNPKTGESNAKKQVKKWEKQLAKDQKAGYSQFVSLDLHQLAYWRGDLHYLVAVDKLIGQQKCSHFGYVGVVHWLGRRTFYLHSDRLAHSGRGKTQRELERNDQIVQYDTGGIFAIDPNRQKIITIARQHGVNVG